MSIRNNQNKNIMKSEVTQKNKSNSFSLKSLFTLINYFAERITKDEVGVYSAQASFFVLLSIFPIIMLFLNIISFTTIPQSLIPAIIKNYAPSTIRTLLLQVISDIQGRSSGTAISITAILAIWSASKGALSLIYGTRKILVAQKDLNYFVLRFYSMLYTVTLIISMVLVLVLLVFGNGIFSHFVKLYPVLGLLSSIYTFGRYVIVMFILTLFFVSIFKMGGNKNYKFMDLLPGAMFASLGWMIFSYLFSMYIDNFSNFSYMYGSLTAVIVIMLWLYFCMYIMFIGAEINVYLYNHK